MISGVLFSAFFFMVQEAAGGDNGVSAYGVTLLAGGALFGASIVIVPFFLNFPVKGQPLTVRRYFKIDLSHHVLGLIGGFVFTIGWVAGLTALNVPLAIQPAPVVRYLLTHGAPLVAVLWGLLVWQETKGAAVRVQAMMGAMFVLMVAGMGLIALSPTYGD
jgi:glucose uptake protein